MKGVTTPDLFWKTFHPICTKGTLRKEPCARLKIPKWFLMAPKKAAEFR